jgi:hypothetical protein
VCAHACVCVFLRFAPHFLPHYFSLPLVSFCLSICLVFQSASVSSATSPLLPSFCVTFPLFIVCVCVRGIVVVDTFASHRGFNPCESLSFVLDAAHYSAAHLAVLSVVDAVVSFFFFLFGGRRVFSPFPYTSCFCVLHLYECVFGTLL